MCKITLHNHIHKVAAVITTIIMMTAMTITTMVTITIISTAIIIVTIQKVILHMLQL